MPPPPPPPPTIPPPPPPPPPLQRASLRKLNSMNISKQTTTQIYSSTELSSSTDDTNPIVHKSPSQLLQEEIRRFRNQNQRRRQNIGETVQQQQEVVQQQQHQQQPLQQQQPPTSQPHQGQARTETESPKPLILLSQHPARCPKHKIANVHSNFNINKSFRLNARPANIRTEKNSSFIDMNHQNSNHNRLNSSQNNSTPQQQQQQQHQPQHTQTPQQPPPPQNSAANQGPIDAVKKSRYILFSQIYLIVHVSITLCLSQYQNAETQNVPQIVLTVYTLYILIVSMIFFMLLRFHASPSGNGGDSKFNELTEQSTILFGATLLGLSEILLSGVNVSNCIHTEFILVPICKLAFALFMIHFLLTQVIHSECIGIRNVAIAHILATQLSLFILAVVPSNQSGSEAICLASDSHSTPDSSPEFKFILALLSNQFKLLTIFILLTIWFTNNQSKINFIRAKLSDEEMLRTQQGAANGNGSSMLHDFLLCAPFFILTALTVTFEDRFKNLHSFTEIFIQILTAIVSTFGLLIRRRNKYLNPKYQINLLKHHHIILVSLSLTYVIAFVNIVSTGLYFIADDETGVPKHGLNIQRAAGGQTFHERSSNLLSLMNWTCLLVQITIQTYLLRLQGKKLVHMSRIFALLVVMNICLWMLNLYSNLTQSNIVLQESSTPGGSGWLADQQSHSTQIGSWRLRTPGADLLDRVTHILSMFVTLNRFYCAMIFCHFWRMQQF